MRRQARPLEQPVLAICAQSNLKPKTDVSTRDTYYSSIHFVGWVDTRSSEHTTEKVRVEIQIRSALEDVWGEIDHELQLQMRRKDPTLPKNRHLVVLKELIDAIISYVHIIKKQTDDSRERPAIEKVVARSVASLTC